MKKKELLSVISRLSGLLNDRDEEIAALVQTSAELCPECGWRFLVPDVGCQGCERARLAEENERLRRLVPPIERGPGVVGEGSWSAFAMKVVEERDELRDIIGSLRALGVIDQFNRLLPLEGHHEDCGHGKDGWSTCQCDELRKSDDERDSPRDPDADWGPYTT